MKKTEKVTVYLNPRTRRELSALAKQNFRTLSNFCGLILRQGIKAHVFRPGKN